MKSERRHELQTNTLARSIENLPNAAREHGSKLALVVIVILLAIVLVRLWIGNKKEAADQVAANLTAARSLVATLRTDPNIPLMRPDVLAERRRVVKKSVEESVAAVLKESTDPARQAEAKVVRGDLYWQIAAIGELPEATTRESLRLDIKPSALLDLAATDYSDVLGRADQLPNPLVISARFGLAAIAENRSQWDKARDQYQDITRDGSVSKATKDYADARLRALDELRKPLLLADFRQPKDLSPMTRPVLPLTQPVTQPATALFPTTLPGTLPAAPETMPSTVPATAPTTLPATSPAP